MERVAADWIKEPGRYAGFARRLSLGGEEYGFCWIPPGEFDMGSPKGLLGFGGEADRCDDESLHHVVLTAGFWLLETPVTQRFYERIMETNPSRFRGVELPVESASWNEAVDFCERLTELLPEGTKASLPTESQWEYSCRAGTSTPYFWGKSLNGDRANCDGNYPCGTNTKGPFLEKTTPPKSYAPNPWGLYDMHGLVNEWTLDWYGRYPKGTVEDPRGADSGEGRVMRGGSWDDPARACRSASRDWYEPDDRYEDLGFRVLLCSKTDASRVF